MSIDRTPYCTKIRYGVSGAPILDGDDMDGSHAPGVGVRPTLIEFVYSAARDGKPASVSASVTGQWTRFGKREPFDDQMTTHFKNGPDGWPAWLAEEARLHDPAAVLPPPADRAAVLLWAADQIDAETRQLKADEVLEPDKFRPCRDASAQLRRLAAEAQQEAPGPGADLIEDYVRFLRGQSPEPDLSHLAPKQRDTIAGQFEVVRALADRNPNLPPLDRDPVARRLGLHAAAAEAQQPERSDVGAEFVRQADQPDENGLAAFEEDLRAAAVASCPGYEMSPSPCRCPCYGCKHHCGAHQPDGAQQPECSASISGRCLRESQSETACDTDAGECVGGGPGQGRPAEAQQQPDTETPAEDPARIDRLRPEFTDHASIESIDAQLRRARAQERRWHIRAEWLISLRQARAEQKARGEWPATVEQPAAADIGEEAEA